jgi:endonuclease-3
MARKIIKRAASRVKKPAAAKARPAKKPTSRKAATSKPPTSKAATSKAPAASGSARPWSAGAIEQAFHRWHKANPQPKGELIHLNPFTLLVAVVLSAQATDAGVNKATPALFALADTPGKMAALGEDRVRELIKTIGLFRTKAKHVVALSQRLLSDHGGEVPRSRELLETLPGVGRKTANVVLNIAFGEPTIAVDTHIFRIGNRTGLAPGNTPFEVEQNLERAISPYYKRHAHHWLILHGRYVCVARKPLCERCLIADLCKWPGKTTLARND